MTKELEEAIELWETAICDGIHETIGQELSDAVCTIIDTLRAHLPAQQGEGDVGCCHIDPDKCAGMCEQAALTRQPERVDEGEPDWYYCDIDPDEGGDSAYEAMFHYRDRLTPVLIHSSYFGPDYWGVICDSLEDDGEEAFTFSTKEEAEQFIEKRKASLTERGKGGE